MTTPRNVFLTLLLINLSLPLEGLANLPLQFIMKDQLNVEPVVISIINVVISLPVFVAWLAGFVRDAKGGGRIDRLFLTGGILVAACSYAILAINVPSVMLIAIMGFVVSAALLLAKTSVQAIMSQAARHTNTENRAGALWNIVETLPTVVSFALGPWLLSTLGPSGFFLICGGLACVGLLMGSVAVGHTESLRETGHPPVTVHTIRNLFVDWAYLFALLVMLLFAIQPGWQTPILFYLTKVVGLSQADYGYFWAFSSVGVIVGCILYRASARYASEHNLLRAATLIMVIQGPSPLFITDITSAFVIATMSGVMYWLRQRGLLVSAYPQHPRRTSWRRLHGGRPHRGRRDLRWRRSRKLDGPEPRLHTAVHHDNGGHRPDRSHVAY